MSSIEGAEAHHLATVCRFRPGDQVTLFNGDGQEYQATITDVNRRMVTLNITAVDKPCRELHFQLEVAAPIPKGDRGDFLIEKLTEIGATTFVPLRTERSVIHPKSDRPDRWTRAVIEASKQCGRNRLLTIEPIQDWTTYCRSRSASAVKWLGHPHGSPMSGCHAATQTCVAVGPEGGLTAEEIDLAVRQGWRLVSLGPRILRIETAALAMATFLSLCPTIA